MSEVMLGTGRVGHPVSMLLSACAGLAGGLAVLEAWGGGWLAAWSALLSGSLSGDVRAADEWLAWLAGWFWAGLTASASVIVATLIQRSLRLPADVEQAGEHVTGLGAGGAGPSLLLAGLVTIAAAPLVWLVCMRGLTATPGGGPAAATDALAAGLRAGLGACLVLGLVDLLVARSRLIHRSREVLRGQREVRRPSHPRTAHAGVQPVTAGAEGRV